MTDVEFSEEKEYADSVAREKTGALRGFARFVIRLGLAKDETGANIVLIGIALIVTVLAVVLVLTAA